MKKHRGIKILVFLAVIVGVVYLALTLMSRPGNAQTAVSYTEIYPSELVNSINIKGTVESVEKRNVYTTLGYMIKTVSVEVGDSVTEGQILCVLDTDDLELNLAQQKADLEVSRQSGQNSLSSNLRIYQEALDNLSNGTNNQILNAENSLKNAELSLQNAQKNYDDALLDYEEGTNTSVLNARSSLTSAQLDLDTKETTYKNNKVLFEVGAVSQETLTQSEDAYVSALNKYNDAAASLENAETSQKRSLEQLESTLTQAVTSYENAVAALNTAKVAADQDLEKYRSNIASSEISANTEYKELAIQKLEKQLEDSIIKAPISGTVTAVYAKEGAAGSGLMFVIEDTDSLKITTKVKEYDAAKIKPGMEVSIRSDSTGDATYEGVLSKVSPAAVKNASGDTASTSDVEFAAEVGVISKETGLKIGMNARLNIVLEKKDGAYRVPYDAVMTGADGGKTVYAINFNEQGLYTTEEIPVTTGMETDFYIEIFGESLKDGMKIVNDAAGIGQAPESAFPFGGGFAQ